MSVLADRPVAASRLPRRALWLCAVAAAAAAAWGAWWQPAKVDYGDITAIDRFLHPVETNDALRLSPFARTHTTGAVALSSDGRVAMVTVRGKVLRTDDGGKRWRPLPVPAGHDSLGAVAMSADGRRAVVGVDRGAVLRTEDGGETWTRHGLGDTGVKLFVTNPILLSADGLRGLIKTDEKLLRTADGGRTWSALRLPSRDVALASDGLRGLVLTRDHRILRTEDGGATWTEPVAPPPAVVSGEIGGSFPVRVNMVALSGDGTIGLAALRRTKLTSDGRLLRAMDDPATDVVMRTTDAGKTWTPVSSVTGEGSWQAAISGDGRHAIVVEPWAAEPVIHMTADGGATWQAASIANDPLGCSSCRFVLSADGRHGMLARKSEIPILRTADGGLTWQPPDPPFRSAAPWPWGAAAIALAALLALGIDAGRRRAG